MANYNGNKKKSVSRIIAGILCGVMSIAAVAGAGTALYMGAKNNGWFKKEEDTEVVDSSEESSVDNLVVNEGVSASKLSISSSRNNRVVLLGLVLNFVTPVMTILKYAFKGIVYVLSLPFQLIKSLFKRDG